MAWEIMATAQVKSWQESLDEEERLSLQWNDWYRSAIPKAERLYEQYLAHLRSQGEFPDP